MTPLGKKIAALIEATGPITVADWMAICLFDPDHGYYTTREPFGLAGDFTTAPEVSQMFGELVAVWLYSAWQALGAPRPFAIAELGPGRGTLMKDMLRTWRRLDRNFVAAARILLVEASPRLAEVQKTTLGDGARAVEWKTTLARLPELPILFFGNEIFDALPVRQFVRAGAVWRERCVGVGEGGTLRFALGAAALDPSLLPEGATEEPEGAIFEHAPAREAMMDEIVARIARRGGAGLFLDYGHLTPGFGDTLQAVRRHEPVDVLADPGEADLTSHVDFAALARVARGHGLDARTATQGEFLLALGLLERAGSLGSRGDDALRAQLTGEVERLAGPQAMGDLFKVLAVLPQGLAVHPFTTAD